MKSAEYELKQCEQHVVNKYSNHPENCNLRDPLELSEGACLG